MTTTEAAERLGITSATIRQRIAAGRGSRAGRAERRGRDWWITPREVERYRRESLGRPGRRAR
jgi:excisionase family DNA binding protein